MAFNLDYAPVYCVRRLPAPDGVGDGLGWSLKRAIKAVKEVVKHPLKQPLKTLAVVATGGTGAAYLGLKEETRGRIQRRVGGVVTGAVTGFLSGGGPIGGIVGGVTGGMMAKKGVRGIKGYAKIGAVGAVTGLTAGFVTGAGAQALYGAGTISQTAAQSAIMASGQAGMFGMGVAAGAPILSSASTALSLGKTLMSGKSALPIGPDASAVEPPSGQQLYSENWAPAATPTPAAQSYMDMIRQTASAAGQLMPRGAGSAGQEIQDPSGMAVDAGLMPQSTGEQIPGQVDYPVQAGILAPENIKWLLIAGGIAVLLFGTTKARRRRVQYAL